MSAALDAAIRVGCPFEGECQHPECYLIDTECLLWAKGIDRAFRAFLNAVQNSQQPISYDAMQTLREHLK